MAEKIIHVKEFQSVIQKCIDQVIDKEDDPIVEIELSGEPYTIKTILCNIITKKVTIVVRPKVPADLPMDSFRQFLESRRPSSFGSQEGDTCNRNGCEGKIYLPKIVNCSCHISAPCSACTDTVLKCDTCDLECE